MVTSVFDLFKVGIGPSSSHTVGPMIAAHRFLRDLIARRPLDAIARVHVELYGSLAMTGAGHATDKAIVLGLLGETPDGVDPDSVDALVDGVRRQGQINLFRQHRIDFHYRKDIDFRVGEFLPKHPNGMRFTAYGNTGEVLYERECYSIGGGFVLNDEEAENGSADAKSNVQIPFPFSGAAELLEIGQATNLTIAELMLANEKARRDDTEISESLSNIWSAMNGCIERGMRQTGVLPGGLMVKRRANEIFQKLQCLEENDNSFEQMDWVSLFALAVNEENAAGSRVVTAPTNGAAGIIPAVIAYYDRFIEGANEQGVFTMLLTAAAIGSLYKKNASISAAEVGCQGEVGVACSMAAAALAAVLGGSNEQIENAAEIGMEHNLGLTCDPIGGLVQIPCIERNTMGAVKAINAARLALHGDGTHMVSLDSVIETMRQTGADMQQKYKETSTGGLAVNFVKC